MATSGQGPKIAFLKCIRKTEKDRDDRESGSVGDRKREGEAKS